MSKGLLRREFLDIYLTTFSEAQISEKKTLWGSYLVSKYSKFHLNFKNAGKNCEKVFCFSDNCTWISIVKLSPVRTRYFLSAANVLKSSPKIWHVNKRDFFQLILSMNRIKVLWCRFQQCFATFTMLLVKGLSQTGLLRHLSDYIFIVLNFKITKSMKASFLSKCSKFHLDFKNAAENREKVFSFWDERIWFGIVKLSLLRRGYFL